MKTDKLKVSATLPVDAKILYNAWLDSKEHAAFTGGAKAVVSKKVGGKFTAWDSYISGENIELEEGKRILQNWRSSEFPEGAPDSKLELIFEEKPKGCKLIINHWDIPEGQGDSYKQGWKDFYFEPIKEYYSR